MDRHGLDSPEDIVPSRDARSCPGCSLHSLVRTFAIQLARLYGARVIATASAKDAEFVPTLGVEQVVDCEASRFDQHVRDAVPVREGACGDGSKQDRWKFCSLTPASPTCFHLPTGM
jgi:hypothetical protein